MKKIISILVIALAFSIHSNAQDKMMKDTKATVISLEQTKGEFTQKEITLEAGAYVFEIENNNVGHQVGFVLAPKSNPDAHIKTAYVTKAVDNNSKETSNITNLEKGEYVYFCPMNPTPQYTLIVN
ncbi:cupredoxin domain-containing protein [Psychroserpens ponticola]|uniref:Cupredoxin domain-containing protein n=1 Tax=Psychroserpens ponticola TaxID=2932268 RepID=A0ABY7RWJ8_9FLAO|nr:cupredoxin domain-containing protein [Psychroserpens ponticola]WCO01523.1 cupredoxin domain-containing protein [Psychroserpens ponticola]